MVEALVGGLREASPVARPETTERQRARNYLGWRCLLCIPHYPSFQNSRQHNPAESGAATGSSEGERWNASYASVLAVWNRRWPGRSRSG